LSVDAFQVTFICVLDAAVATRLPGTLGALVSAACAEEKAMTLAMPATALRSHVVCKRRIRGKDCVIFPEWKETRFMRHSLILHPSVFLRVAREKRPRQKLDVY